MGLHRFHLIHFAKLASSEPLSERVREALNSFAAVSGWFHLETCQRSLWMGFTESDEAPSDLPILEELTSASAFEHLTDAQAFARLLKIAAGLESAVIGETDVFGQLKAAWGLFEARAEKSPQRDAIRSLMRKLFEDTKEVRTRFMQGLGGASYGSLVRKVLKPQAEDQILLIGAGKAARAVLPYVGNSELSLWNRTRSNLEQLLSSLKKGALPRSPRLKLLSSDEDEVQAWETATHVIVCVPPDEAKDPKRIEAWLRGREAGHRKGRIVHLGCLSRESAFWSSIEGVLSLEALFELQNETHAARARQVGAAKEACVARAETRFAAEMLAEA